MAKILSVTLEVSLSILNFETAALLQFANGQHFPLTLFARFYRVTDEPLIA